MFGARFANVHGCLSLTYRQIEFHLETGEIASWNTVDINRGYLSVYVVEYVPRCELEASKENPTARGIYVWRRRFQVSRSFFETLLNKT